MTEKKYIVKNSPQNARLDIFLSEKLDTSRSQAQKMINDKKIMINGKEPRTAGLRVKEGDTVVVATPTLRRGEEPLSGRFRAETPASALGMTKLAPVVITETADYLVIEKPSGLLVHPTQANEKNTLADWLLKKYPKIKNIGDNPKIRPGIVHRLDKEASGLMVVAKSQKMFDLLKEQFKKRTVEKEYFALAHGKIAKDWDEITFPIARSENFERMAARPLRLDLSSNNQPPLFLKEEGAVALDNDTVEERLPAAKAAHTEFFVEKRFVNFTLLRVILHTGRMHQIRVHLFAYNHPLVGDPLYFQKKQKRTWDEKCGRLFLHSIKLCFNDLEGNKKCFESPLPKELKKFLELVS